MDEEIEKALIRKIKSHVPEQAYIGKVKAVNEDKYTCTVIPIDSDVEVFKVRLKPTVDSNVNGVVAIPDIESFVIVGKLNNNENSAFVIWCSKIKKYWIKCEDGGEFEITDGGIVLLNGDEFGGLVKVSKNVARLNKIEDDINKIKQFFAAWTPVPNDGGAALKAVSTTWSGTLLEKTVNDDIENTKVKHGSGSD